MQEAFSLCFSRWVRRHSGRLASNKIGLNVVDGSKLSAARCEVFSNLGLVDVVDPPMISTHEHDLTVFELADVKVRAVWQAMTRAEYPTVDAMEKVHSAASARKFSCSAFGAGGSMNISGWLYASRMRLQAMSK